MSIVTKTGDKGETALMYGRRLSKADMRVEAYGCVDELTSALGLARAICQDDLVDDHILAVQKDLIIVMGELATAAEDRDRYVKDGFKMTSPEMVDRLTQQAEHLEKGPGMQFKDWVIPGGTTGSAALDVARGVCRRAERSAQALNDGPGGLNPEIIRYLNRLSDLCWLLARYLDNLGKPNLERAG
jgi:cob(I)alamin adenosyltransferase